MVKDSLKMLVQLAFVTMGTTNPVLCVRRPKLFWRFV